MFLTLRHPDCPVSSPVWSLSGARVEKPRQKRRREMWNRAETSALLRSGMEQTRITGQPSCEPVSLLWLSRYAKGGLEPPPLGFAPVVAQVSSLLNLKSCSLFHTGLWAPIRAFYLFYTADASPPPPNPSRPQGPRSVRCPSTLR